MKQLRLHGPIQIHYIEHEQGGKQFVRVDGEFGCALAADGKVDVAARAKISPGAGAEQTQFVKAVFPRHLNEAGKKLIGQAKARGVHLFISFSTNLMIF